MSKRYRSTTNRSTTSSDLKDLSTLAIGFAILFVIWFIAICIQAMITYWFISVPVIACIAYAYLKYRTIQPAVPQPTTRTVNTIEDIKINNGTRRTTTSEKYNPEISTTTKLLNRIL